MILRAVATTVLLLAAVTRAEEATTRPTVDRVAADLEQLGSADAFVREAALVDLMGLTSADLPILRAALPTTPLRPEQADGLREALLYVLTRDKIRRLPESDVPFMGLLLTDVRSDIEDGPAASGTAVRGVLPGFAAARHLQGGDVIVGLVSAGQTVDFQSRMQFMAYIAKLPPGTEIALDCRRAGRAFVARFRLDCRPGPIGPEFDEPERLWTLAENARVAAESDLARQFKAVASTEPAD